MIDKRRSNLTSFISWKKIFVLLVFAGGVTLFFALGGNHYLSFETLRANRDALLIYTEQHYWRMLIGAMVTYTAATALSLPVASGLSLIVGFLFGRWVGMAVILFSATLGATLVFLGARYVFAEAAQRRMGGIAQKMIAGFHENDFNYLLFLRLVPGFPFWLVNLVPAFTPIKVRIYVLATAIGITPGCFVFTNLGQSLGHIESPENLFSLETISALVLLGIFALLPIFIKKYRSKKAASTY